MLERWEVNEKLQFLKEDVIEGLNNENSLDAYMTPIRIPPILIPF